MLLLYQINPLSLSAMTVIYCLLLLYLITSSKSFTMNLSSILLKGLNRSKSL
uniref:ATP synthase membrane subunit 8 n=1 Tax=Trichuris sp. 2 ARS-2017 TaxID=2040584 RepID=A0A8F5DQK7_9BILA|nr:ATP synthase membrane subunit 8 [Trichuris sp. 2 ARS-2017]